MKTMENRERGSAGQHQGAAMKKGWETKRLGEVCEIIKGRKPTLKPTQGKGDLPYLVAKFMRGIQEPEYASVGDRNSVTVEESETIIICDGSNSGEVFTGYRGILSSTMGKIAKKAEIHDGYLRAFLASTFEVFNGAKTGAAIPHLDKEAMYGLDFSFPPLAEQQRIVGLLDEAFEGLATAKANAEKNLQNARALFESHLQSVFTQRGQGWVKKRLDKLAEFSQGIQVGLGEQSNAPAKGLVRFIRIIDYTQGTDDIRYVPDPGRRYWADKSDIVMVRYGTPGLVGRGIEGVIANNLFKISIRNGSLTNDFLAYFLSQQAIQDYLSSQGSSTMPALTFKQLGAVIVSFPNELEKQNAIVAKLDALSDETQRLAHLYELKLAALDALKKSLLHQAFSGGL